MIEPSPLADHHALPACSILVTEAGLLVAKIASVDDCVYGLAAYVLDDNDPHAALVWGRRWRRILSLTGDAYENPIRSRAKGVLRPRLGKILRIEAGSVVGAISAQHPALMHEHADLLRWLAEWLDVPRSALGIYGSAMYKAAAARTDLDFVVYGEHTCRAAWAKIRGVMPQVPHCVSGRPYHLHFPAPEGSGFLDPRFIAPEDFTADLVAERFVFAGAEPMHCLQIVDDSNGIFYPARYTMADGSVLLSYRLGHCGLFQTGDRVSSPALPILARRDVRYRAVLRYEHLIVHTQKGS